MTNDINLQIVASQRTAPGASKAQGAAASERTAKPDPSSMVEAQAKAKAEEAQELSVEKLDDAVQRLNDLAESVQRQLRFSVDDDTGRSVITVTDKETDEVIRQIPSEEVLNLISRFQKFESGILEEMV